MQYQDMVRPLKQWLLRHRHNPYPTKGEKVQLAVGSNMTLVQVTLSYIQAHQPSPIHQTNFLPLRAGLKLVCQRPPEAEKRRAGNPLLVVQTSSSLQSVCPGDISQNSSVQEAQQGGQYLISGRIMAPQASPDSRADFDSNLCLSGKCGASFHFI